eukprot:CAMPEP_0113548030 /NCGR_PEP_ID=MMETSP0015_2-20120614/12676_1 /TAXON_ID=2838 /ORGANISM="Odontella" /LENGTH=1474 /DNA_ID=CAMNT_0000448633 /DNA_START=17 /DNA_END=4441 /DNA_ORIENTATION=- /assembly_acc=CAM_ASM_000160
MATPSRSFGGSDSDLSVNNPVSVEVSDSPQPLQGVIAHLGPVKFSPDPDWVGVRLTGPSVGQGKNDGSVRGVRYFGGCGANGGVFVRKAAIRRRTLTRLEELRLKRELASAGADASTAPKASARPSGIATPSTKTSKIRPLSSASSAAPPSTGGGATKSRSRLDEIRERRAALAKKSTSAASSDASKASDTGTATGTTAKTPKKDVAPKTPAPKTPAPASKVIPATLSTPVSSAEDKAEIASLKEQLTSLTTEKASLQTALAEAEQKSHDARAEAQSAKEEAQQAEKEKEEAIASAIATASAAVTRVTDEGGEERNQATEAPLAEVEELRLRLSSVQSDLEDSQIKAKELEDSILNTRTELDKLHRELDHEKDLHHSEAESHSSELAEVRGKLTAAERELSARDERDSAHASSETSHYKERAKLHAELAAARRKVEELESDAIEKDTVLEELALDKEAVAEEKEGMEDRLEEMKIDLESAQLELDEAKTELEMERERAAQAGDRGGGGGAPSPAAATAGVGADSADADDVARALSSQNARLREALLRLREQSAQEKMEMSRQLRSAQRDAETAASKSKEMQDLRSTKNTLEEEVKDLKEMVDQNAAYEGMVEDLSDRVMGLEDDNAALRATAREMEEAADVAAEMEEVQAEESRQLLRDLEARDAALRNLEEAIKMQRRREEEFQKTVGNFRSTVETLRQEKSSLLALQEGSGDERSRLVAQSHRALARAARLVADATRARKRDADAAFHGVEAAVNRQTCRRLETIIPAASHAVAAEVAAVRGEMALARVAAKAATALAGVEDVCAEAVRKGTELIVERREESKHEGGEATLPPTEGTLSITDEQSQRVRTALHQAEFAEAAIGVSSDCSRLLSAGQWPDLLAPSASAELGSTALRVLPPVEVALDRELRTLKEEGGLSPHRSKLSELAECARDARTAVDEAANAEGDPVVPQGWVPPGWEMLRTVSRAKFYGLCAAAALAAPLSGEDEGAGSAVAEASTKALCSALSGVLNKVDRVNAESAKLCHQLSGFNVNEEKPIEEIGVIAKDWVESAKAMFDSVKSLLSGSKMDFAKVADCDSAADGALRFVAKVSSCVRSNKIVAEEGQSSHALSPESRDPWEHMANLVRKVRIISGDEEDLNYIIRAHVVESQLTEAIDNETKLSLSNARASSLEKSLASRSKEIGLQNARLSELERLLSQTSTQSTAIAKSPAGKAKSSTEEVRSLKEENRVLNEAMETLYAQVDEYEKEIKSLKSFGKLAASAKKTPRKGSSFGADLAIGADVSILASAPKALALEAALFRPALSAARSDASKWKAKSIEDTILGLPPLSVPKLGRTVAESEGLNCSEELLRASSQLRLARASFTVVDLSTPSLNQPMRGRKTQSRVQLQMEMQKSSAAFDRLQEATCDAHDLLSKLSSTGGTMAPLTSSAFRVGKEGTLLGKISLRGGDMRRVVPLVVNRHEMRGFHSQLLH